MRRPGQLPARSKAAFPPRVDEGTRRLFLGSLPGDASIRQGEYYAHRGNAFWALMGDVLGEDLRGRPYAMRLKRLKARAVGLWDVIERSEEHTYELKSLMRISYAVFCLKNKKTKN